MIITSPNSKGVVKTKTKKKKNKGPVYLDEKHFILRLPPKLSQRVSSLMNREKMKNISIKFLSQRNGVFKLGKEEYHCTLFNIPTFVETYKSLDMVNYFKIGEITQILQVFDKRPIRSKHVLKRIEKDFSSPSEKRSFYTLGSGLTGTTRNIKYYFEEENKKIEPKDMTEVQDLYEEMCMENEGEVTYEIVPYESEDEILAKETAKLKALELQTNTNANVKIENVQSQMHMGDKWDNVSENMNISDLSPRGPGGMMGGPGVKNSYPIDLNMLYGRNGGMDLTPISMGSMSEMSSNDNSNKRFGTPNNVNDDGGHHTGFTPPSSDAGGGGEYDVDVHDGDGDGSSSPLSMSMDVDVIEDEESNVNFDADALLDESMFSSDNNNNNNSNIVERSSSSSSNVEVVEKVKISDEERKALLKQKEEVERSISLLQKQIDSKSKMAMKCHPMLKKRLDAEIQKLSERLNFKSVELSEVNSKLS